MDPQNILNSKGFIIEMIKTGTNENFLLKNTLKTDAVFTIHMAAEQVGLSTEYSAEDLVSFKGVLFKAIMIKQNFETTFFQALNDFKAMP